MLQSVFVRKKNRKCHTAFKNIKILFNGLTEQVNHKSVYGIFDFRLPAVLLFIHISDLCEIQEGVTATGGLSITYLLCTRHHLVNSGVNASG